MKSSRKELTGQNNVIDWLMEGDPSIRWQTMRDLQDKKPAQYKREQQRITEEGWGLRLLSCRASDGTWGGGIYTPKWTSTNYTLLVLRDMGLPRNHAAAAESAGILLDRQLESSRGEGFADKLARFDLCITGMYLALMVYFGVRDERIDALVEQTIHEQMADGGWNCARRRHRSHHSSLHTTINILDGLADYAEYGGKKASALVAEPMRRAQEFMLQHRLFRSDKTGEVIKGAFTQFSFPPRWHYDVLRALDYFRRVNALRDERLSDAMGLLLSKRKTDGRWLLENHHAGKEFFKLEKPGQPSRWNTLRALRVLRWWEQGG